MGLRFSARSFSSGMENISNCDSLGESYEGVGRENLSAGQSPELRKLLVRPRNKEEFISTKRLLTETLNLTKAAISWGIIQGNLSAPEFKLDVVDNPMFRTYATRANSLDLLLGNLNIDEWGSGSFVEEIDAVEPEQAEKRKGVLIIEDNVPITLKLIKEPTCEGRRLDTAENISNYVNDLLVESEEATGVPLNVHDENGIIKRKRISPDNTQVKKFQRVEDHASPILRLRGGKVNKRSSPPLAGASGAVSGKKNKKSRVVLTARRSYTPQMRQLLINSMFSPKNVKNNSSLTAGEVKTTDEVVPSNTGS